MAVKVERDSHLGVPEQFGHHLGVDPLAEEQLWETIGIHRAFPDHEISLPPLPGRGIDGPDLGL